MEANIKKYFWLVSVLAIACCAYFAVITVGYLTEEKGLDDSAVLAEVPPPTKHTKAKNKPKILSKKGNAIVSRNMFCSACLPEEVVEEVASGADSDTVPTTSLPLRLLATNVSTESQYSFATIQNTSTERQGSYGMSQQIPDGGEIVRISVRYVDFRNAEKRRVERINLLDTKTPTKRVDATREPSTPRNAKEALLAEIEEGVNKVSDTEFELDRKVVDKVLANPASVMKGARVRPHTKDGKTDGFKLFAIRPNSLYAKLGLKNGDTIHSVNGMELNSVDAALRVYSKLRTATSLSVNATRRGKPVSLNYTVK